VVRRVLAALAAALLPAAAAAWPDKPVQILVTVSAGGSIDLIARTIGAELASRLHQPVLVENRPGANGNIAAAAVAHAAPDGYTLLATGGSTLNLNPFLYRQLAFDPVTGFAPVTLTAYTNFILVVRPTLEVNSVAEFIALAKKEPGRLNYGSAGNGSLTQIATELFNSAAGIRTSHVPYKGLSPAVNDLLAGQIDFMFDSATTVPYIKSGKLKALAVVGPKPLRALPQLKVLSAYGVKGVDVASGWHGVFAPAGTPADIVRRLNTEIVAILKTTSVQERIVALGAEPASSTPEELARRLARDLQTLGPVVKRTGATLD